MSTSCLGAAELKCFEALTHSSGFRFSLQVQHAWCARRVVNEGLLTLSILREDVRLTLLAAWMKSTETLLDFISQQLPDPSAELAMCRFEQLTFRAHHASVSFVAPDPSGFDPRRLIRRSDAADLALFENGAVLLVAPGVKSLYRSASPDEKRLWARLLTSARTVSLIEEGFPRATIEGLLQVGALEFAC